MGKLNLAITVLALCVTSLGQSASLKSMDTEREAHARTAKEAARQAAPRSPFATLTCSYNFSSGSGNNHIDYCVSLNGNIASMVVAFDVLLIDAVPSGTSLGEGYGLCDANVPAAYYDYGYTDSGNWGLTALVSQSATVVKLTRTTSDGIWTLTQTITLVSSSPSAKIVMTLKNNTAVARTAYLVRYANATPDGVIPNSALDGTLNSAFVWNSAPNPSTLAPSHGFMMQNVGNPQFPAWGGLAQSIPDGPNPCAFAFNWTGGVATHIDGSEVLAYVGTVPAKASKTITMSYKGM